MEIPDTQVQPMHDLLKDLQRRLERLERRQDALIEHVEELEDKIDIDRAKAEMERTGEQPIPLEQIKAELDR